MGAGSASVFHGGASGIAARPPAVVLLGAMGDSFGFSVGGAGDLNGDGFGDVIVGAPFSSPGSMLTLGLAAVFHGSARGVSTARAQEFSGSAELEQFGFSVAANRQHLLFMCDLDRRWFFIRRSAREARTL